MATARIAAIPSPSLAILSLAGGARWHLDALLGIVRDRCVEIDLLEASRVALHRHRREQAGLDARYGQVYEWQDRVATSGDSGGAVFTSPNAKGEIKAAGITIAATIYDPTLNSDGTVNNSGDEKPCLSTMKNNPSYSTNLNPGVAFTDDCYMVHMPIDYVDDQQLLTVNTRPAQP